MPPPVKSEQKIFVMRRSQSSGVESHFWNGTPLPSPAPITTSKLLTEFIGTAFCALLGARTSKLYVTYNSKDEPVLISKIRPNWRSCKVNSSFFGRQLPPIPLRPGIAEIELAHAVLSNTDTGWFMDNLGIEVEDGEELLTTFDLANGIIDDEQLKYWQECFKEPVDKYPDGIGTLADNPNLDKTYLLALQAPSIANYDLHYRDLYRDVTPEMRQRVLRRLFAITESDIRAMVERITNKLKNIPPEKTEKIITSLLGKIELFRNKFAALIPVESNPDAAKPKVKEVNTVLSQRNIVRSEEYAINHFKIIPTPEEVQDKAKYANYSEFIFVTKVDEGNSDEATQQEMRDYLERSSSPSL